MNDPQPEGHVASHIERRKFLATLGGAALIGPSTAIAQTPKVYRLGTLTAGPPMSPASGDAQGAVAESETIKIASGRSRFIVSKASMKSSGSLTPSGWTMTPSSRAATADAATAPGRNAVEKGDRGMSLRYDAHASHQSQAHIRVRCRAVGALTQRGYTLGQNLTYEARGAAGN
jgi:hypothetical protein